MTTEFSIRQLLACLNVSVFDPVIEPALEKACLSEREQETGRGNPFYNMIALIGMIFAALLCFYGLRSYPFAAGVPLFVCCGAAMYKTKSYAVRFFLKTYFISSVLLLTEACFRMSPAIMTAALFIFLTASVLRPVGQGQRILLSLLFFFCVYFVFQKTPIAPLGIFFMLGTAGLLFPLKNTYGREPAFIFVFCPLVLILAGEILNVPDIVSLSRESWKMSAFFASGFLILFVGLYRDLEINEIFRFLAGGVALLFCGVFLSAGIEGSLVLFLIAFFTNFEALKRVAVALFCFFFVFFILSLPISLSFAGIISLTAGVFFEVFRLRLRQLSPKE
ncbi:MAG: hypothetical protein J5716_01465 [Alphaproteobacteria bacterium]|nr:hypothetical protein [Alphaproteobacteria bacterium]